MPSGWLEMESRRPRRRSASASGGAAAGVEVRGGGERFSAWGIGELSLATGEQSG
jgi:hypothetical protein